MTAPSRSTTHTCVSSIDTSSPAKKSMVGLSSSNDGAILSVSGEELPSITRCCKSLFALLNTIFPACRHGDRIIMWGTTSTCDELTGNFGSALEDTSIGDRHLFHLFATN